MEKKILLAVYVEAHSPASQRRMTLRESLHRPQPTLTPLRTIVPTRKYLYSSPRTKIHFSSTLVEGHKNTLLGKHCREIHQTDNTKVRACASHTTL